jgi:pimeloyl-ACP methyl ester carboxylesterase
MTPSSPAETLYVTPSLGASVELSIYGKGPRVVLAHGWEGRGLQLGAFVDPLVERGMSVVVFDMPAHGDHEARSTNALEFAATLRAVQRTLGSIHSVIGHSLGATATLLAMANGLALEGAVLVAPMPSFKYAVQQFGLLLGITLDVQSRMSELVQRQLDFKSEQVDLHELGKQLHAPIRLIHDETDRIIPVDATRRLLEVMPAASLQVTSGLGHQRILSDESVVADATRFITRLPRTLPRELERAIA